jgi:C-terminal processing protease CtpA/Prc
MKQFNFLPKISFFTLFFLITISGIAQEKPDDWMFNPVVELDRNIFKDFWGSSNNASIYRDKINDTAFFAKADSVLSTHPEDSTTLTEFVKLYRGALDLFTYEDPHFRIYPSFIRFSDNEEATKKNWGNYILALPFNILQVNDSLIIDESLSKDLLRGDMILSINGVSAKDLLDYTYRDRYIDVTMMQLQNSMMFSRTYYLTLIRNGKTIELNVTGVPINEYNMLLTNSDDVTTKIIGDVGYISIENFIKNKRIINELRGLIKEVQDVGGHSIIIDIRKNLGGTGEDFDKLISIFTSKEEIDFQKDVKTVISEKGDAIGKIVSLPDSKIFKQMPLKPKLYMGEMDYYILMSKNTDSQASTFANIIQYNNLGLLAGEPLRHNAYLYGDADVKNSLVKLVYSTIKYDEYTKAIDGIIYPDINIPYIAKEYMKGGDPMLEKLLEIINTK